jgi:hypothetical protein
MQALYSVVSANSTIWIGLDSGFIHFYACQEWKRSSVHCVESLFHFCLRFGKLVLAETTEYRACIAQLSGSFNYWTGCAMLAHDESEYSHEPV